MGTGAQLEGGQHRGAEMSMGMIPIPGGTFSMGSDSHYPEEAPAHRVTIAPFKIDRTPVTNRQFRQFVKATGHVTVAEVAPDPKGYPGELPCMLRPGSLVFTPPRSPIDIRDLSNWWTFQFGANWRRPFGRTQSSGTLWDHPVVHIAFQDAEAYAIWAGKALPTEAEWEFAARGGLDGAEFAWGNELLPAGRHMANIWQGRFPYEELATDGYRRTSPVGAFSREWLWPLRYDRQRLGVDRRLVLAFPYRGQIKGLLRSRKCSWRDRGRQCRSPQFIIKNSPKGRQGWLASLCPELLPPISPGSAPRTAD